MPNDTALIKALKAKRWVLACERGYAALSVQGKCIIVSDISSAEVFDGRDNEVMKLNYYGAVLKTTFIMEMLPCES